MSTYASLLAVIQAQPLAHIVVLDGYSGLGYANASLVAFTIDDELRVLAVAQSEKSKTNGQPAPLYVVAGATPAGIGMCYDSAEKLRAEGFDIVLVGIVSASATVQESWGKALSDEQAARLDHLVVVADPNGTWQVLNEQGQSLMVDIAFAAKEATFSFYGGGAVANSELVELAQRLEQPVDTAIEVVVRHGVGDFAPRADKAEKKYAQVLEKALGKGLSQEAAEDKAKTETNGTRAYKEGTSARPELI